MYKLNPDYKLQIDNLRKLIKAAKNFDAAIQLALDIHAITHTGEVSASATPTFCDNLLAGLTDANYSAMPIKNGETIAWHLWHLARIEDMVVNILIMEQAQIFDDEWISRMNTTIKDTGNAMTADEMIAFSRQVNKQELVSYRNAVGAQTRKVLRSLTPADMKRKPSTESLERLVSEGGLLETEKSLWLKDFWGNYTIAGLILLPLTRHHMIHMPDSVKIKELAQGV